MNPLMLPQRIRAKIDFSGEHWLWVAGKDGNGYGKVRWGHDHRIQKAHRVVYEILVGAILGHLESDHLCPFRACVMPLHLEPVTHRANMLRGDTVVARNARKAHCPREHPYSAVNTLYRKSGARICRTCARQRSKQYRLANKAIVFDGESPS